jgi:hypothetical protein
MCSECSRHCQRTSRPSPMMVSGLAPAEKGHFLAWKTENGLICGIHLHTHKQIKLVVIILIIAKLNVSKEILMMHSNWHIFVLFMSIYIVHTVEFLRKSCYRVLILNRQKDFSFFFLALSTLSCYFLKKSTLSCYFLKKKAHTAESHLSSVPASVHAAVISSFYVI